MSAGVSALTELADAIRAGADPVAPDWPAVHHIFHDWADVPGRRAELQTHLRALPETERAAVVARSKEATTHFAWCLLDRPADPFSLWLHQYKPYRDWLPGYANSVHNHRYHFCTTLLSGSYLHERFSAELDADATAIRSVARLRGTVCPVGTTGYLLSHEFHRIPRTEDGTITFLVKSRMIAPWSLSFDPDTGLSHRHIPMGNRLADLPSRL